MEPILTSGVVLIENNKVLLVRHKEAAEHLTDTYGIPAGRLEPQESYIDAAVRELKEEAGLDTSIENLIEVPEVYEAEIERKNGKKLFSGKVFLCTQYEGTPQGDEENEPLWVDLDKVESLNIFPNVIRMINDARKLAK